VVCKFKPKVFPVGQRSKNITPRSGIWDSRGTRKSRQERANQLNRLPSFYMMTKRRMQIHIYTRSALGPQLFRPKS